MPVLQAAGWIATAMYWRPIVRLLCMPAWAMFGIWVLYQAYVAVLQSAGATSVSAAAHFGGAAVGLLFAWICKD